jgi:hypothetical protein
MVKAHHASTGMAKFEDGEVERIEVVPENFIP